MSIELCGEPTKNGPCNMPKGHAARFHRHRKYKGISWTMREKDSDWIARGEGINNLNYAIATNRESGSVLLIEIICA